MNIAIRSGGSDSFDQWHDVASLLLHDPFGAPVFLGMEYRMPEGIAWTLCSAEESDFHKILATSGILHTLIPGCRSGTPNLLCTPILGKGIPRWVREVDSFFATTGFGVPLFYAKRIVSDRFETGWDGTPGFRERWNRYHGP